MCFPLSQLSSWQVNIRPLKWSIQEWLHSDCWITTTVCTVPPPPVSSYDRYVWEVQHNQGSLAFLAFPSNGVKTPAFSDNFEIPPFSYPRRRLDSGPDITPCIHHQRWHPCGIHYVTFGKVHWSKWSQSLSSLNVCPRGNLYLLPTAIISEWVLSHRTVYSCCRD